MIDMETLRQAAGYVRAQLGPADIGIVLGSGLGSYTETLENRACVPYKAIPDFPVSTAPGHEGKWWAGDLGGKRVYMLQGRIHFYEGRSLDEVTMYVRMMKLLGVRALILTNAAGCVNASWEAGDLMLIRDFINYSGINPLIGPNLDEMGPRFPDMGAACDKAMGTLCLEQAKRLDIRLREGVYMWFSGPSYETPAEVRMARILGADAVGMSTVPELIVARHCGLPTLGISCLTNMAAGILDQPLNHLEVMEAANRVQQAFRSLITATVEAL